jgi:hypothetical protein
LRARVNGQLTFRYERTGLTSYAGLECVRRWLHREGLLALSMDSEKCGNLDLTSPS